MRKNALLLLALAAVVIASAFGPHMQAHAFSGMPRLRFGDLVPSWARPADAGDAGNATTAALSHEAKRECPPDIVDKLRDVDFAALSRSCPTRSGLPHDLDDCAKCSCHVYDLVSQAIGVLGDLPEGDELESLAFACGPIFSLDTAFDGANARATLEFLGQCRAADVAVDYTDCAALSSTSSASGGGRQARRRAADPATVHSFLTTSLAGVTEAEALRLVEMAEDLDLAEYAADAPLVHSVSESVAEVKAFVALLNTHNLPPERTKDSSVLCPGFATAHSCESFPELVRACPWSCERQDVECMSFASEERCEGSEEFRTLCPVTCYQIGTLAAGVRPQTVEGVLELSAVADGSALKEQRMQGTIQEASCLCFNVFQPVCGGPDDRMFNNLCEAQCEGIAPQDVGACREDGNAADVAAFAAGMASSANQEECKAACPAPGEGEGEGEGPVCEGERSFPTRCHAACEGAIRATPSACGEGGGGGEGDRLRSPADANSAAAGAALPTAAAFGVVTLLLAAVMAA